MRQKPTIAVIVSQDRRLHSDLESALNSVFLADTVWHVSDYPESSQLERLRETPAGCVLFLDFSEPARARKVAAEVDRAYPDVSVVAIQNGHTKDDLIALMQLGIREVIGDPISPPAAIAAYTRALRKLTGADIGSRNSFAFVPGKPGAGATTIATNVAWALARLSRERTLLLDFDLRLGITSFLMKLDGRHSIQDALNASVHLDEVLWVKLVCRRENLDVLGSAPLELPAVPSEEAYNAVLDCAERLYTTVCIDLPGAMEPHEVEILNRAKEIFLVCTADVAGLHMAKRKAEALQRLQLHENVTVLLNRTDKRSSLSIGDVEKILDLPVRFTIPSDERAVARSVNSGQPIQSGSPIASQIDAIAKSIAGSAAGGAAPSKQRFVDYFSISPVRERSLWKR
jgi:pilus assembly protein CpaE